MNYLFFDIECANRDKTGRNQIYSFGYLLADENLNVLTKEEDILINPNIERWDWHVVKNILAYPKAEVEKQPKFCSAYKKIKALLENPQTVVCGFSVKDDVGYLLDECERYALEPLQFQFYDVQRLIADLTKENICNLSVVYAQWCGRLASGAHRSDVDALYTYEIAKALCKKEKQKLIDLFQKNEACCGRTNGFRYGYNDEELLNRDERNLRSEEKKLRKLNEENQDYILRGTRNHILFARQIDFVQPKNDRERIFDGKSISISMNYEIKNFKNMLKIIQAICDCGGKYVRKASLSDIFVTYDDESRPCSRLKAVEEEIENGADKKIMTFAEFLGLLGLTEETLNALPDENVDYLWDDKYRRQK